MLTVRLLLASWTPLTSPLSSLLMVRLLPTMASRPSTSRVRTTTWSPTAVPPRNGMSNPPLLMPPLRQELMLYISGKEYGARKYAENFTIEEIEYAIKNARAGDVIILAGKGHETEQIFADRTVHFDEREIVREILRGM